jgi:hypothetical protein
MHGHIPHMHYWLLLRLRNAAYSHLSSNGSSIQVSVNAHKHSLLRLQDAEWMHTGWSKIRVRKSYLLKYNQIKKKSNSIQINHQLHATISPVLYLTFIYSSTCFGRSQAHHQELNNCSSSLWFYFRERGDSSAVGRSWADRPDHDQRHCYHHTRR